MSVPPVPPSTPSTLMQHLSLEDPSIPLVQASRKIDAMVRPQMPAIPEMALPSPVSDRPFVMGPSPLMPCALPDRPCVYSRNQTEPAGPTSPTKMTLVVASTGKQIRLLEFGKDPLEQVSHKRARSDALKTRE